LGRRRRRHHKELFRQVCVKYRRTPREKKMVCLHVSAKKVIKFNGRTPLAANRRPCRTQNRTCRRPLNETAVNGEGRIRQSHQVLYNSRRRNEKQLAIITAGPIDRRQIILRAINCSQITQMPIFRLRLKGCACDCRHLRRLLP
jgi:hypothetical protein